jgi:hypothetical protein
MKIRLSLFIATLLPFLVICSCDTGTDNSNANAVSYTVYEQYYYIGPRSQRDTTFFHHTTGKAAFDALFQYNNDTPPIDTIPQADLATQSAISFVKNANDWYGLEMSMVYLRGDTLSVEYTATVLSQDMSYRVVQSRIVMTDAIFREIKFIENGQVVKRL